ncbi:MAG: GTP cyclohydrolase I [Phototrophicaceae bacterium]
MKNNRYPRNGYANGDNGQNGNGSSQEYKTPRVTPRVVNYDGSSHPQIALQAFDDNHAHEATEIVTGSPEQRRAVEDAIRTLLDAFNVNWDDPNYTDTPQRVANAYIDHWASGYARDPKDEITVFPNTGDSDDIVIVKDMRFYSLCSHHLAPIEGYAAIAYIPDKNLLGLSKLGRILEIYARRFQLQERIGQQTADALMELLEPLGVMVVLYNVTHGCMSSRGVKLHEANTTTVTARGAFKHDRALRQEVMSLINIRNP